MEEPKPNAIADALVEVSKALVFIMAMVLLILFSSHHQTSSEVKNPQPQAADGAVDVPGITGYTYTPGLADQFKGLSQADACQKWQRLAESQKYGLAFIAPKSVPSCAETRYVQAAAGLHHSRKNLRYLQEGRTYFYDLGSPALPSYYTGSQQNYSCKFLTRLTSTNYRMDPMPKPKNELVWTAADDKAFQAWDQEQQGFEQMQEIYLGGGRFAPGCYPPGAVFGKDGTITFYPQHPVKSLAETPAPVFTGHNLCNVCFRGPVYRVKSGDTLEKISTCFYGENWEQFDIQANNNLSNHNLRFLQIGQKLHLPNKKRLGHCVKPIN
jgi:hypothetical protein